MLVGVASIRSGEQTYYSRRVVRFRAETPATTKPAKPRLFYLGIGVTELTHAKSLDSALQIRPLKYSGNDARALEAALRKALIDGGRFDEGRLTTLAGQGTSAPTRDNIEKHLTALADEARPDDLVVVMLAGHGFDEATDPASGESKGGFYFVAQDSNADLAKTGVTGQRLNAALARLSCPSLLLLDACHSEAVRPDVQLLDLGGLQLGPQILTACGALETSKEHDELKHGLFTYSILEALGAKPASQPILGRVASGDGQLSLEELCRYVKARTPVLLDELRAAAAKRGVDGPRDSQTPEVLSSLTFEAGRLVLSKRTGW
jgi:uncharacterized caspase-like protein